MFAFVLFCAAGLGATGLAEEPRDGRSDEDLKIEKFLLEAEIIEDKDLGEGITRPRRLVLKKDGVTARALFKTIDRDEYEPSFTSRVEMHFTDKYVYEYAAYRLDRYLGLNIVPVTVLRKIDNVEGSAQFWIEDAMKLQEAMDQELEPKRPEYFMRSMEYMHVLDALIYNIDRNPANILVTQADRGFHAIDHSRAFRDNKELPWYGRNWSKPLPDEMKAQIKALDKKTVERLSAGRLTNKQVKALLERRDLLLEELP
jgi:hypothetical protein